jgi:CRISPR-associated protein Csb1
MDGQELYDLIRAAVSGIGPSVFRSKVALQPAGGWDLPVLRAAVYSDGATTFADGGKGPGPVISRLCRADGSQVSTAIIQSVEARGHRLAEAIRDVLGEADAGVPLIELYRCHPSAGSWDDLLTDSFEASHHVADAAWREALDPAPDGTEVVPDRWKPFWDARGKALDPRRPMSPAALLSHYPVSLFLGYDPRGAILSAREGKARRGRRGIRNGNTADSAADASPQARLAPSWGRVWRSEIVAEIDGLYYRTQSLLRRRPAMLDSEVYVSKDGGWTLDPVAARQNADGKPELYPTSDPGKPGRPSAIGLDNVTPALRGVPDVWARSVTMTSYLSLAGLRNLFFGPSDRIGSPRPAHASRDADVAARTLIAALGVAATVWSERDLRIRSDCDLVLDRDRGGTVQEFAGPAGTQRVVIDLQAAIAAICRAVDAAHAAPTEDDRPLWQPSHMRLVARPEYAQLVAGPAEES